RAIVSCRQWQTGGLNRGSRGQHQVSSGRPREIHHRPPAPARATSAPPRLRPRLLDRSSASYNSFIHPRPIGARAKLLLVRRPVFVARPAASLIDRPLARTQPPAREPEASAAQLGSRGARLLGEDRAGRGAPSRSASGWAQSHGGGVIWHG